MSATHQTDVWLDCDPGHDDAMAMILAAYSPRVHLLGLSSTAGNQTVAKTTTNILKTLTFAGLADAGIPVARGLPRPVLADALHCPEIHGASGLDGPLLPDADGGIELIEPAHKALQFMFETMSSAARERGRGVTLVATGPLTNVAVLLLAYPSVRESLERIVLMGGAIGVGNTNPVAEFNMQVDPEAAAIVMESGVEVVMVPLEVTHTALVDVDVERQIALACSPGVEEGELVDGESGKLKALKHLPPFAHLIISLLRFFADSYREFFGFASPPLHDPCAVAYVIDPELFTTRLLRVDVELASTLARGQTVVDSYNMSQKRKNVRVATAMNVPAFWELMCDALRKAAEKSPVGAELQSKL